MAGAWWIRPSARVLFFAILESKQPVWNQQSDDVVNAEVMVRLSPKLGHKNHHQNALNKVKDRILEALKMWLLDPLKTGFRITC